MIFTAYLIIDWITGTMVACKDGNWSSKASREGIWHKMGSILAVTVAGITDLTVGLIINNIPSIHISFSVLICPVVLIWYIISELGSITENAGKMGAPVPKFLKKVIAMFKSTVDNVGDKIADNK